jgi:hypothetical protein
VLDVHLTASYQWDDIAVRDIRPAHDQDRDKNRAGSFRALIAETVLPFYPVVKQREKRQWT